MVLFYSKLSIFFFFYVKTFNILFFTISKFSLILFFQVGHILENHQICGLLVLFFTQCFTVNFLFMIVFHKNYSAKSKLLSMSFQGIQPVIYSTFLIVKSTHFSKIYAFFAKNPFSFPFNRKKPKIQFVNLKTLHHIK